MTKLRASDGAVLGTFTVGFGPLGIAFDGTNIWIANNNSSTVMKLKATDGVVLGTFNAPASPYGVAFDGSNIWVTGTPYMFEFQADGALLLSVASNSTGVAFDGANIWVGNGFGSNWLTKF